MIAFHRNTRKGKSTSEADPAGFTFPNWNLIENLYFQKRYVDSQEIDVETITLWMAKYFTVD